MSGCPLSPVAAPAVFSASTVLAASAALAAPALLAILGLAPISPPSPSPPPLPAPSVAAFADPLDIDNPYAPFVPGAVKLYRGRESGARAAGMDTFTDATREFAWGEGTVACRFLEERDFEDGVLVELSHSYHAQADDGSVWLFGEVSWEVVDGVPADAESDSWLVGGPTLPGDPPAAHAATEPALIMPAELQVGQVFGHEAFPGAAETSTVVAVDVAVKTAAGKFQQAVKLTEIDDGEDTGAEQRWVVPGLGIVREKSKHMRRELLATSLVAQAASEDKP